MPTELGTPYVPKEQQSQRNIQAVMQAVAQRFPDWIDQCQPYVNVLTFRQWLERGYCVKKGEKAIRITVLRDVPEEDDPERTRTVRGTACLFAFPQVEEKQK